MFLLIVGSIGTLILFYLGLRFYRQLDWDEPAESSPDFGAMRKKQAALQHVQDVLIEAHQEGKLSKELIAEFNRYVETELEVMLSVRSAWENQRQARRKGEKS